MTVAIATSALTPTSQETEEVKSPGPGAEDRGVLGVGWGKAALLLRTTWVRSAAFLPGSTGRQAQE